MEKNLFKLIMGKVLQLMLLALIGFILLIYLHFLLTGMGQVVPWS